VAANATATKGASRAAPHRTDRLPSLRDTALDPLQDRLIVPTNDGGVPPVDPDHANLVGRIGCSHPDTSLRNRRR
jgi:hypothetical protein